MGFLFGIMLGGAMSGGALPQAQAMLSQIPIRCIYLLDDESDYIACRYPSISKELSDTAIADCDGKSGGDWYACKRGFVIKNIKWEIAALKQLSEVAFKRQEAH